MSGSSGSRVGSVVSFLVKLVIVLEVLAVVALVGVPVAYGQMHADKIFPGVQVLGVALGGATRDQARSMLSQPIAEREGQMLTLRYGDRTWTASAAELGLRYDLEATVDRAFAIARGQGIVEDSRTRLALLSRPQAVDAVVQTDRVRALDYMLRLARNIDVTMQNASLAIENLNVVAAPARTGYRLDVEGSAARIVEALAAGRGNEIALIVATIPPLVTDQGIAEARALVQRLIASPVTVSFKGTDWALAGGAASPRSADRTWTIERSQLAAAIIIEQRKSGDQATLSARFDSDKFSTLFRTIAKELNREVQDARFDRDERTGRLTPIRVSQEGRTVDVAENVRRLAATASSDNHTMQLAVTITKPAVAVDQADKLGIRDLLGRGLTSFAGSRESRAHNIRLAASRLHGVVLPPGATFSLLNELGPITEETGFQQGYAIVGEFTVEDVGGGVCQVATTVFRSAFWAGLPIVERNPHRYVVAIYQVKGGPVGLDAAIYDPGRDLRFKNSTSGYLLIQTDATDASNFTVSIYGAKPGWTVEMEGPDVTPGKPNGARLPDIQDPNLPAGTRIPVQPGQPGQNVTLTRIVKQGNTIVSRDTFATAYQPSNEQWVVGTKK